MERAMRHLLLFTILLAGVLAHAAAGAWELTPTELAARCGKTAHLAQGANGTPTLELDGPLSLEMYGLQARLTEGWWRLLIRLTPDRAAHADERMTFAMWNPYGSPGAFRFTTVFAPFELGTGGAPVVISRQLRVGPANGNLGMQVQGGWKGLRLDGMRFEPLVDPLFLTSVQANRLVYGTRDTGLVTIALRNGAALPQRARLTLEVENGLGPAVILADGDLDIPATGTADYRVTMRLPVQAEYGHQLRAVLRRAGPNGEVLGEARDWFYVSDTPVRVGHLAAWGSDKNYEPGNVDAFMVDMRRHYFPLVEMTFWAPDDYALLVPPAGKERWWSGQTLAQLSGATIDARIKAAHAQGMQVLAYTDLRLDFGFRVSELFRRHPEWCNWDANDTTMGWSGEEINRQLREDDAERFDPQTGKPRFGARGIWGVQTGNPTAVDHHIAQLVASTKRFNWDGFRYDDPYDYDFASVDLLGNTLPYRGFTSPVLIARLRGALNGVKPGMIYGHNMEWSKEHRPPFETVMPLDTPPAPDDYLTEYLRDDGLHLQERVTAYWGNGANWETIAEQLNSLGSNVARRGGHAYAITPAHTYAIDGRTLTALALAGRVHLAYWASDWQVPYLRLAARHCDLLYGDSLRPAPDGMLALDASEGREPWWKRYVRVVEPAPGKRIYLVHLINPPVKPGVDTKNQLPPPTINGLTLRWTLPAGWKADRAWQLSADSGEGFETTVTPGEKVETTSVLPGAQPSRMPLPLTVAGRTVTVCPGGVIQWSIIAVECSGPAADRLPAWRYALPPVPAQPAAFTTEPAPAGYSPNGFETRVFPAGHSLWKQQQARIPDMACADGMAVKLQGSLTSETYFSGITGGRYRFMVRVKSPGPPPANAVLHLRSWPSGRVWMVDKDFPLAGMAPGAWSELQIDADLGWDRGNCGIQVTGGWDGLLIDRLEVRELQRTPELASFYEQKLRPWPAGLAPDPNGGAWCMLGLWSEALHLDTALQRLGVPMARCDWYVFRNTRGWNGPQLKAPEDLAKYRLVVLANVDIRTLSLEQRVWLRGWVESGGTLLMTGGPYGLGRGWWQESDLFAPILPAVLKAYDLRPQAAPVPLRGVGPLTGLNLGQATTVWLHELTPKPGVQVGLTAGGKPVLLLGTAGKGRVALLGVAPLGEDVPGAWWRNEAGAQITEAACRWLLQQP
jgi:hypothetical protein